MNTLVNWIIKKWKERLEKWNSPTPPGANPPAVARYMVQVDGKKMGYIDSGWNANETELQYSALMLDKVADVMRDKDILDWVIVPKRLINIITKTDSKQESAITYWAKAVDAKDWSPVSTMQGNRNFA